MISVVIAIICAAASCTWNCLYEVVQAEPSELVFDSLHDGFKSPTIDVLARKYDDGRIVLVDGEPIPTRFEVKLKWAVGQSPVDSLEFVLVIPQQGPVKIDGVVFAPLEPFYICVSQVSQLQYAVLYTDGSGTFLDYSSAEAIWIRAAECDSRLQAEDLTFVRDYLSNPQHPTVLMEASNASRICAAIAARSGLNVRMPTLTEWFCAAPIGGDIVEFTDDLPWDTMLWPSDGGRGDKNKLLNRLPGPNTDHVLGLIDILGAVADIVYPSDDERNILKRHYGANADQPSRADHNLPAFEPRAHSVFRLGAGIDAISDFAYGHVGNVNDLDEFYKKLYYISLTTWECLLGDRQYFVNRGWWYQKNWATGLRPVIEVPAGKLEVIQSAKPPNK